MTTLLVIVWLLTVISLLLHQAVQPRRSRISRFELKRLNDTMTLRRERLFAAIVSLRRLAELVIVAVLAVVSILLWQGWGIVVVIVILVFSVPVSRLRIIRRQAERIYAPLEAWLLDTLEKRSILRSLAFAPKQTPHDPKLESPEQLLHLVESSDVLSSDQLTIVKQGLSWPTTAVSEVMAPRSSITSIKRTELLGPLVLDDLHKSGHKQFPVTKAGLDNIIGVLDITESLEVTANRSSQTAEQAMTTGVIHVASTDLLPQALELLQKSRQHMLIVTDQDGKTVGLVTLADITGSLLGKTGVE